MKRGSYKTEAVVLNSFDFGESDRLVVFYSSGFGKLRAVAKGARRSRRRFVGNLEPTCHVRLMFFHPGKGELVRAEDATLIAGFNTLRSSIESYMLACYMLELADEMTREGMVQAGVLSLLVDFLGLLEGTVSNGNGATGPSVVRFFEIKLLSMLGYMPQLKACVACGDGVSDTGGSGGGVYFSSDRGGLVCPACSMGPGRLLPVSNGTAALLSMAARLTPEKLFRLRPAPGFFDESETVLDDFIKHQLGKELKTRRFMDKLRRAPF